MSRDQATQSGGCLCGAVRYEVHGPLRDVINCHCTMCQRLHGAFGAHSKARKANIAILQDKGLKWYATSGRARRGFCCECGSNLFWEAVGQDATGIVAGTHIFIGEKCDFYDLSDDLPKFDASSDGAFEGDHL